MPLVTPTLNLPQPPLSSSAAARSAATPAIAPPAPPAASPAPAATPPAPSATVTLSPQALSAMAAASHPSAPADAASVPAAAITHDNSVYESLKSGITSAVQDVGDAIAHGAHAVEEGVEDALSNVHTVAKGIVALPFALVSRAADAAGALIDKL